MFLRAYRRLCAVGMGGEEQPVHRLPHLVVVSGEPHVVLLVHRLQLGVETAYHHVLESVALYSRPVLHLVCRNVLHVAGHVVARVGVAALRAYSRHQFVILVRNVVPGSELRHAVYSVILRLALFRVGHGAVCLIHVLYGVEQRSLLFSVRRSEAFRSLEHQVLQIVCQSCRLSRVVAASGAHGYVGLYARFLLVYRQIYLQSVVQSVYSCRHRVTFHRLVRAPF